jgi:hypothetical protein
VFAVLAVHTFMSAADALRLPLLRLLLPPLLRLLL